MTEQITGYKFQTEQSATNAANSLTAHYLAGRPPAPARGYSTTKWVDVSLNIGVSGNFFYFQGSYAPILGSPSVFDIDLNDPT